MPHYDGPAFNREPAQSKPSYDLPPRTPRRRPATPAEPAPARELPLTAVGQHSVDPLAALIAVPRARRHQAKQAVDYAAIMATMQPTAADLYLLSDAADETPWAIDETSRGDVAKLAPESQLDSAEAPINDVSRGSLSAPADVKASAPVTVPAVAQRDAAGDTRADEPGEEPVHAVVATPADASVTEPASAASAAAPAPAVAVPDEADAVNARDVRPEAPVVEATAADTVPAASSDPAPAPTVPATVSELIDTATPLPAEPQLRAEARAAQAQRVPGGRPSKLPNPYAVRDTVRAFLKAKKAAKHTAPAATQPSAPAPVASAPLAEPGATVAPAAYQFPPLSLLSDPVVIDDASQVTWVQSQTEKLDATLLAFHVGAHTVAHTIGPTVTQFQIALDAGVRVNKITNLTDDLKRALAAKDIRIEAPIPGKSTVGIEIPNPHPRPVMLKEVLNSPQFKVAKSPLTVALGVDLFGQPVVTTLDKMPHGLIAGATGSGKSVFINSLLTSLLYKATPAEVRLLLIDPKAVELAVYNDLPHLVSPVVSDPKAASAALKWAVDEMEKRYTRMAAGGVRSIDQFNESARAHGDYGLVMPHIVIIIDELADLMMVAASEVQDYIARITAKARAAGIHLIVATQRPSVDVITGTIKNNIPTRVAFMVASQVDSRTIIDHNGAERLLGKGDMLYLGNGASQPLRLQGTFVDREIDAIVAFVRGERAPQYLFQPDKLVAKADAIEAQDDLFPDVLTYIAGEKNVSTSKLQRVFSIGYNRAANLIDDLEMRHYISPANGSKPRDVYFNKEDLPTPKDSRDPRAY
ncbi:DNA translocase FtsK [Lacticaseibacillus daqingensis]|uniref:DNA translocase FtsK n=1 Tax=Lacticaseibacillus daqingensis TaxID=2486014 RepID=UPI000F7B6AAF|nr:DNA translocase FtsK [Lacticaseibacillus daqingensis]